MVKIVNRFGDVKIGKQGEVVYQRKYGKQIRRGLSPKRAIASETQIAHRQLYRDALDWRKQLSLPNRRYLDGYPIANGVIDSYGIPLPWSRFALKLYLEKVKFVTIIKPTLTEEEKEGKHQAYDNLADKDSQGQIYSDRWYAQTFTPTVDLELTKLGVYLKRTGNPTTLTAHITATDISGHPTGGDLATAQWAYGTVPTSWTWQEKDISVPCLNKGELYALILELAGSSSANYVEWGRDQSSPTFANGSLVYSGNGGVSWTTYLNMDMLFRIYGKWTEKSGEAGLLHVRHPALLAVVQKRQGVATVTYDDLSSLDDEYLTKQVGIDVLTEDYIEATTLPGIKYAHLVR